MAKKTSKTKPKVSKEVSNELNQEIKVIAAQQQINGISVELYNFINEQGEKGLFAINDGE